LDALAAAVTRNSFNGKDFLWLMTSVPRVFFEVPESHAALQGLIAYSSSLGDGQELSWAKFLAEWR
jgi:hypothetical protein